MWKEVYVGEKVYNKIGEWLFVEILDVICEYFIVIKGLLMIFVGGGI